MNILHNIYSVGPGSFGLGPVALNLCREQNALGHRADIWCHDTAYDAQWAEQSQGLPPERIHPFPYVGPKALSYSPALEQAAMGAAGLRFDIVHQHALWLANSRATRLLGRKRRVPSVIAPHGMLEAWALQRSPGKKKIAQWLYEGSNLRNASCLHALSVQEVAGFREFGLRNPVAVIPNGISGLWLESEGNAAAFRDRCAIDRDKRIILFLSRITPVKGLPLFMEALAAIRDLLSDWVVVVAGNDEFGHLGDIRALVGKHRLERYVLFPGLLIDQAKRDAYAAADLFVLPTRREAAPVVVLEALGAGVPVLTTKGAPWEKLVTQQCGWWTDVDAAAIGEALRDAVMRPSEELRRMGRRGKEMVAAGYTWTASARMTIELYEWLLGRNEKPDFVALD